MNEKSPSSSGPRLSPARVVEIPAEHEGRRLDKYLRSQLKGVPAGLLFRLLRKGKVRVNDRRVEPGHRLHAGDRLQLPPLEVQAANPPPRLPKGLLRRIEQAIVHEDDELLVIDKPAGVAVHVGTDVAGGVIEALRQLRPDHPDLELVHRLDRDTSGLLMVAKSHSMLRHLQKVLREETGGTAVDRRYVALVHGAWPNRLPEVDAPLRRPPGNGEGVVTVHPDGQPARTRFSVLRRFGGTATLVEVRLLTGRKHQIRVHARHAGHPIGGDPRYGDDRFNRRLRNLGGDRLFLHASELRIPLPSGRRLRLTVDPPATWESVLERLDAGGAPTGNQRPPAGPERSGRYRSSGKRGRAGRNNPPSVRR